MKNKALYVKLKRKFANRHSYPVLPGITPSTEPNVYRGDLLTNWIQSKSSRQLQEIDELENLTFLLKGDGRQKVWKKVIEGQELSKNDLEYVKIVADLMEKLHKMKYGEKRVSVRTSFKDIREMMFGGDSIVNTPSDGGELSRGEGEGGERTPEQIQPV